MSVEDLPRSVTVDETRRSLLLWFAVLGSPLAWAGHLVLNYSLEEWFACSPSATHRGEILGFTVAQVSVVLNAAMALIAVAAGVTGLACWRRLRRATDGNSLERARWMAFAGIVEGAIFLAAILLGFVPPLLLRTCASVP